MSVHITQSLTKQLLQYIKILIWSKNCVCLCLNLRIKTRLNKIGYKNKIKLCPIREAVQLICIIRYIICFSEHSYDSRRWSTTVTKGEINEASSILELFHQMCSVSVLTSLLPPSSFSTPSSSSSLQQRFLTKPLTAAHVPDRVLGKQSGKPIALIEVKSCWPLGRRGRGVCVRGYHCDLHTWQISSVTCQHPDGLIFPACASIKRLWVFCMASCTHRIRAGSPGAP